MLIEEVKKMSPLERFLYWIRERHTIYLRRRAGQPKPWTNDEGLQTVFFTNPYREHDKVTVWFRENIREPLRDDPRVLFATVCFRWFNLPSTADVLRGKADTNSIIDHDLLLQWDAKEAFRRLDAVRSRKQQVFTGAYMINSPGGEPKLEAIIRRIDNVWQKRDELLTQIDSGRDGSMESAHSFLTEFDGMGGFMAYEVVCDLRYTYLLENAPDKMTWCNPGPGCIRGYCRVHDIPFKKGNNSTSPPVPKGFKDGMIDLLDIVSRRLKGMPRFEMREIEHSLCEADKYERVLWGDGKAKRTYRGA